MKSRIHSQNKRLALFPNKSIFGKLLPLIFSTLFIINCESTQTQEKLNSTNKESNNTFLDLDDEIILPPVPKNQPKPPDSLGTPLPSKTSYLSIKKFLEEYQFAWTKFAPLPDEYRLFFRVFVNNKNPLQEDIDSLSFRIRENPPRAHWILIHGMIELMEGLADEKFLLLSDKEDFFLNHMKVLSFLGKTLTQTLNEEKYMTFTRNFYISISKRYFNRTLKMSNESKLGELE